MPVIHIFHRKTVDDVTSLLRDVCEQVSSVADIPPAKVWALWHAMDPKMVWRPDWNDDPEAAGPIVRIFCRRSHPDAKVQRIVNAVREGFAKALGCRASSVFVQVLRVNDEEVFNVS